MATSLLLRPSVLPEATRLLQLRVLENLHPAFEMQKFSEDGARSHERPSQTRI